MTQVKAFRAVTYNQNKFPDMADLICPPYDVISPLRQQYFHDLNPYNFIHLILGKDTPGEDKYKRAGALFRSWLKEGALKQEDKPAVYFYLQEYNLKGERKTRMGFIGLMRLEDGGSAYVHEHTRQQAKQDRLNLVREVRANLSPIFAVFPDKKRVIKYMYDHCVKAALPFIDVTDDEKTTHRLWRIDSPDILARVESLMAKEDIFIADGHHRYEVSMLYRQEMKGSPGGITGEENFNYILTYFTNADSRGLTILPIHRLAQLNAVFSWDTFIERLKECFDVEEVRDKARFFFLMQKGGRSEHLMGMYKDKKYWLIRLKNIKMLDKEIPDRPKEYRSLDVSILNYLVLHKILGIDLENKHGIVFSPDEEELIKKADNDSSVIVFFLNPVRVEQIMAVALKSEKMPPKSTYFYPKLASGLVINKFD